MRAELRKPMRWEDYPIAETHRGRPIRRVTAHGVTRYQAAGYCMPTLAMARAQVDMAIAQEAQQAAYAEYRATKAGRAGKGTALPGADDAQEGDA